MSTQGLAREVIEDVESMNHAEKPTISWGTRSIHDGVGPTFEGAVSPLSGILVLVVGLRVPTGAMIHPKDVLIFVRILNFSIVNNELGHGSPKSDVIF